MNSEYSYILSIGAYAEQPLYAYRNWMHIYSCLSVLVEQSRHKPWMAVQQEDLKASKPARFGRLSWTPESFAKWTHMTNEKPAQGTQWNFESVEMWCPGPSKCEESGETPDILFMISNEEQFKDPHRTYDYAALTAISTDAFAGNAIRSAEQQLIETLGNISKVMFHAAKIGGWDIDGEGTAAMDYLTTALPANKWLASAPRFEDLPPSHSWRRK